MISGSYCGGYSSKCKEKTQEIRASVTVLGITGQSFHAGCLGALFVKMLFCSGLQGGFNKEAVPNVPEHKLELRISGELVLRAAWGALPKPPFEMVVGD